jgi:multicomponent Na+:H+ antiporter subunit G
MNEQFAYLLIALGLAFDFFGCLGLVRLPDVFNRLQAATKCVTVGTCSILLGMAFLHGFISEIGLKSILCIIFIGLTSPTAAHAIARGAHIYKVKLWEKTVIDQYREDTGK